jgi:S-adenosylmethionine synthetase
VVAAGLAERCEIQVAYAIGVAHPVSINVETFGTGRYPTIRSPNWCRNTSICARRDHPRSRFAQTNLPQVAAYGHFGRDDLDLTWERTDKADALRKAAAGLK